MSLPLRSELNAGSTYYRAMWRTGSQDSTGTRHWWLLWWWDSCHDASVWNVFYLYFTATETDDLALVTLCLSLLLSYLPQLTYNIQRMVQMISKYPTLLWSLLNIGAIFVPFTRGASEVGRSLPLRDDQNETVSVAEELSELHARLLCWHLTEASKPAKARALN